MIRVVRSFNDFYRECPVLTAEPEVKKARLKVVDATRIVLKNGLSLFGIDVPREM